MACGGAPLRKYFHTRLLTEQPFTERRAQKPTSLRDKPEGTKKRFERFGWDGRSLYDGGNDDLGFPWGHHEK
jgi:hypothetical protein